MKNMFIKLFCLHKWNTHNKVEYTIFGMNNELIEKGIREVLICSQCGKIKTIQY